MRGNKIFPGDFVEKHYLKIRSVKEHKWKNLPGQKWIIALARKDMGYSPTTASMDIWRTIINNYEKHEHRHEHRHDVYVGAGPVTIGVVPFSIQKINKELNRTFQTLNQLFTIFVSEQRCETFFEDHRWGGGKFITCPHCGSVKKPYTVSGFSTNKYKCSNNKCYKKFNVRTGTFLSESKLPLQTWIAAIYLGDKITSHQLAKELGITQKTAWYIQKKLGWADVPGRMSEVAIIREEKFSKNPVAVAQRREIGRKAAQKKANLWNRVKRAVKAFGRGLITLK